MISFKQKLCYGFIKQRSSELYEVIPSAAYRNLCYLMLQKVSISE